MKNQHFTKFTYLLPLDRPAGNGKNLNSHGNCPWGSIFAPKMEKIAPEKKKSKK